MDAPTTEIKASDDAAALMTKTETYVLTKAIGLVEGARLVDKNVLSSLGLGLADCDRLRDIAGSALGPMREKYAEALVSADPNLWGLGVMEGNDDDEVKRVALLTVARMVAAIVDETLKPTADLKGTSAGGLTSYVVTQTEEERSFTLPTWDNANTTNGRNVLIVLHNIRLRPHKLPTLAGMRKVAFWPRNEGCFPDPSKVNLETMKRAATDTNFLKFQRLVYGVLVVMAGEKCSPT